MKKNKSARNSPIIAALILAITAAVFTISCNKATETGVSDKKDVAITEKMFITQVNDVYLNADEYLGKTIKLEGIFKSEHYKDQAEPFCFVVRYGLGGCCGVDANVGFAVKWNKENKQPYPAAESWVEAAGELKREKEGNYLYLDLVSLSVLDERGREIVFQ